MEETDQLLCGLFDDCVRRFGPATEVGFPVPGEPIDAAWSRAADEYCRRLASAREYDPPTPEVAAALIPRLSFAKALRTKEGDPPAGENLLEWYLVTLWHQKWEARWLARDFRQ